MKIWNHYQCHEAFLESPRQTGKTFEKVKSVLHISENKINRRWNGGGGGGGGGRGTFVSCTEHVISG